MSRNLILAILLLALFVFLIILFFPQILALFFTLGLFCVTIIGLIIFMAILIGVVKLFLIPFLLVKRKKRKPTRGIMLDQVKEKD